MAKKPASKGADGVPGRPGYVAYYRVSTVQQGLSGLGLEAQREAVERHVRSVGGTVLVEYVEIESGKKNDRPEVARAIAACRARRAILVIAKLDRLARNVAFVSNLMEAGVEFVACDNPFATRLTIHILAAVAEHEREMISARTTAALAAARARGGSSSATRRCAPAAPRRPATPTLPGSPRPTGMRWTCCPTSQRHARPVPGRWPRLLGRSPPAASAPRPVAWSGVTCR